METTDYQKQANDFLQATGTKFKAVFHEYNKFFPEDKEPRNIYKVTLRNAKGSYTFRFGQSMDNADKGIAPEAYDALACLTKYDPGTFENFCSEYDYDTDSRKAEGFYKAVVKEWQNLQRLFSKKELEKMNEIN